MYGLNMHSNKYAYGLNDFQCLFSYLSLPVQFFGPWFFVVFVVEIRGVFHSKITLKKFKKKSEIRILNFSCLSPAHYFLRFFLRFLQFRSGMKLSWREIRRGSRWDKGGITVTDPIGRESILNQS